MNDDEDTFDCIQVTLTRSPLFGFGIAINGGRDEFDSQSLIISDVIKNGPADGKLFPNDRIINVNGHPVVRFMEHIALKLIRDSTDFVNLTIQRPKYLIKLSDNELPVKCVLNKTRKDDKFGIVLDCRYFIKKLRHKNDETYTNIQENDEIVKINDIPVDRLTLQEAQKLIDKTKEQLVLHTKPNRLHNHHESTLSYKQLQSDYNQHVFEQSTKNHYNNNTRPNLGTRYISFLTDTCSIGIRLAGGNKYGLFICEIQSNSIAYKAGLFIADKIHSVNNVDFTNLTREEAVLYLMNMKTSQVNMIVSNLPEEYEHLLADIGGDSFYIRAHFAFHSTNAEELEIRINDVFHVTDTLYNGQIGYWVATKFNRLLSSDDKPSGTIPNQSRAEQLVNCARNLDELIKSKQSSFKRKLRTRFTDKRSRSLISSNHSGEDFLFPKVNCWKPLINSKFLTYERVRLKSITIIRPVVLMGPLADIARDRLLEQYPDQFELPETYMESTSKSCASIIKLQSIKHVIQKNRHCLLDITPSAIEQLNYAECYPIVIYLKVINRRLVKQIRAEYGKLYQKSSRRLFDYAEQIENFYSYLFTSVIKIDSSINWYELLKSQIDFQQDEPIWMSSEQYAERDLLKSNEYFISTRLSYSDEYQSSPDVDLINKNENYSIQRVASDPMMFQKDRILHTYLPRRCHNDDEEDDSLTMQTSTISLPNHRQALIDMSLTENKPSHHQSDLLYANHLIPNQKLVQMSKANKNNNNNNNNDRLLPTERSNHTSYEKNYMTDKNKINSTNSLKTNGVSLNRNSSKQRMVSSKSSNDHHGSLQRSLIDKSTMTERDSTTNSCNSWNRPLLSTAKIQSNMSNNVENRRYTPQENDRHYRSMPLNGSDEKSKICSNKMYNHKLNNRLVTADESKCQLSSPSLSTLQKPRVFTYDDNNLSNQQQTVLSSSSGSSTLSLKDKTVKEVGETRSYSIQDGPKVIGSARGIIDYYGGKLSCPLTGVSLFVPMGAIPEGVQQEIYFQVHQDSSHVEKFHGQLLSPIVICGPRGIQFEKPVELTIPHSAGNDAEQLSLLLHDSKRNQHHQNNSLTINGINHVTSSNVSILVDHF